MTTRKGKKYARLSGYGDLMIPIALLEKICQHGFVVETAWQDGQTGITKVAEIDEVHIHDGNEIDLAIAQQKLS